MSQHTTPPEPPAGAPATTPAPASAAPQKNPLGLWAMITSIVGFVFACIPGALIVGWVLLPVGFILGIVAVARSGRRKGAGVAAIVLSVVGTIVGIVVFLAVAAGAVSDAIDESSGQDAPAATDDALEQGDSPAGEAGAGGDAEAPAEDGDEAPAQSAGTRETPLAFTEEVSTDAWTIALTGFDADAADEVAAANQFNEEAGAGQQWITLDVAATYTGTDSDTGTVMELSIDYVAADGTVISTHDAMASGLEPDFDSLAELYEGATEDGRIAFLVPDTLDGLIRVTPGLFEDDVFLSLPAD